MLGLVNYLNLLIYGYIQRRLTLVEMTLVLTTIPYPVEIVIMHVRVFTAERYVIMDVDAVTVEIVITDVDAVTVEIVITEVSTHLDFI